MHIIHFIFYFLNNLKIYHWNTKSYSRHKASDQCFTDFQILFDKFIEVYIGKYGKDKLFLHNFGDKQIVQLQVMNDKNITNLLKKVITFVNELELKPIKDSDLITIRDEMMAVLNQTLYLFTLE